jgi:hypothetical protein
MEDTIQDHLNRAILARARSQRHVRIIALAPTALPAASSHQPPRGKPTREPDYCTPRVDSLRCGP